MAEKAVFILAYGTPDSVEEMAAYLSDIRGGRPMSKEFVEEFQHRYRLIGGQSPLTKLTYEQAKKVRQELQKRGYDWPVFVGMRHWRPWIKDAVAQMDINGVEEAVAIVMAPHYSRLSIGKYWDNVNEAQALLGTQIDFTFVDSWYRQPKFLQAVENHVRTGLEKFPAEVRNGVKIVFTAHSLPARLLEMGDPYDDELKDNARIVANRLGDVGGGIVVYAEGEELALVELPIAGLMSNERAEIVAEKAAKLVQAFATCGCQLNNAYMQLSLLALVVIPELRISDMGLVDVTQFQLVDLVV